jgi:magnesium-transporting ATPase (P-type)
METYELLERDFEIVGCSGIEDALQEDVEETIESFRHAGIICWMLTGDKLETAVQIGHACKLIPENSNVITMTENIEESLQEIADASGAITLVIHASILNRIIDEHADEFKQVAKKCKSVICCRMSPLQKGNLVKLMKGNPQVENTKRTLSIGDGANDIVMLREADVGVGGSILFSHLK